MSQKIEEVILFQLDQTTKITKQYSQREMEKLGIDITIEQWVLLKIISESEVLSQRELALKSSRDPASITRTLDILQKKEFIKREPILNNRRTYNISLTNEGERFVQDNLAFIVAQRKRSVKGFTNEELKLLSNMLKRIQSNMS